MARKRVMKEHDGEYLLVVEGSIPRQEYCATIGGVSAKELLLESARGAKASSPTEPVPPGGIAGAKPNPTEAVSVADLVTDKPVIAFPIVRRSGGDDRGDRPHDHLRPPARTGSSGAAEGHATGSTKSAGVFDAGLFASFDDEEQNGGMSYKLGCKVHHLQFLCGDAGTGASVFRSCREIPASDAREELLGNGPLFVRRAKFPQTTADLDKIGLYTVGATVAGIAAHAVPR